MSCTKSCQLSELGGSDPLQDLWAARDECERQFQEKVAEIVRLLDRIDRLSAALKPFATVGAKLNTVGEDVMPSGAQARLINLDGITIGHFRAADHVVRDLTK